MHHDLMLQPAGRVIRRLGCAHLEVTSLSDKSESTPTHTEHTTPHHTTQTHKD